MYIPQKQIENLRKLITPGKIVVIHGPRRVGKTTLLKKYLESENHSVLFVNGDDIIVRQYLESHSIQTLRDFVGNPEPAEVYPPLDDGQALNPEQDFLKR
jgi:predicted AAA+ superfamily ATPase